MKSQQIMVIFLILIYLLVLYVAQRFKRKKEAREINLIEDEFGLWEPYPQEDYEVPDNPRIMAPFSPDKKHKN